MRTRIIVVLGIIVSFIFMGLAPPANAYESSLVAYWKLDESSGNATDSAGGDNNATNYNATQGQSGKFGTSYYYNGTTAYSVPNARPFMEYPNFTFSFWVKMPSGGGGNLLGCGANGGQGYGGILVYSNYLGYTWTPSAPTSDTTYYNSGLSLPADTWVQAAAVVNFNDINNIKLYINGQTISGTFSQGVGNATPNSSYNNGTVDSFGGRWINSMYYYKGGLDDVAVWNRTLTANEINTIYNVGTEEFENSSTWNTTTASWSSGWNALGEPTSGKNAYINSGGTATVSAAGEACNNLYLGYSSVNSGNVSMTAGNLTVGSTEYIGYYGSGAFDQSGGNNTTGNMILADYDGSGATYTLSGGSINISGGYNQKGGIFTSSGTSATMTAGSFTLSGGTFVNPGGGLTVRTSFTKTGGAFDANNASVSFNTTAGGTYTVAADGAEFKNVSFTKTSGYGSAAFSLTDGFTTTGNLSVANYYSYAGGDTFYVTGSGNPTVNVKGDLLLPSGGANQCVFGGLTVDLDGNFNMSSTYTTMSANLVLDNTASDQYFTRTAGTISGSTWEIDKGNTSLIFNSNFAAGGVTVNLDSGTVNAGAHSVTLGSFTQSGGTVSIAGGSLTTGNYTQTAGHVAPTGAGSMAVNNFSLSGSGVFDNPSGGFTVHGSFAKTGGTFNINDAPVNFTATSGGTFNIATGDIVFKDVNFNRTSGMGSATFSLANGFTVTGNLSAKNSYTYTSGETFYIAGSGNPTITVNGGLSFPSNGGANNCVLGSMTVDLNGDFTMSDAKAYMSADLLLDNTSSNEYFTKTAGTINGGTWDITKGPSSIIFNSDFGASGATANLYSGTLAVGSHALNFGTFNESGGTMSISSGGSFTTGNYTQTGGHTDAKDASSVTVNNFSLSGTGVYDNPTAGLTVHDSFIKTGGTFRTNDGPVAFIANSGGTFNITPGGAVFKDVSFDKTGGIGSVVFVFTDSLTMTGNLSAKNDYTYTSGETLYIRGSGSPTITVNGNFSLPTNYGTNYCTFGSGTPSQNFTVDLHGDLTMSEADSTLCTNVNFKGDGLQTVTRTAGGIASGEWHVEKTGGAVMQGTALSLGSSSPLYINSGTWYTNGKALTVAGTFSNDGTLRVNGDEALTLTRDTDSGKVEYAGSGNTTYTSLNYGNTYYDLAINSTTGNNTFSPNGTLTVANSLIVQSGTFDSNDRQLNLKDATITGGTFIAPISRPLIVAGSWSQTGGTAVMNNAFDIATLTGTTGVYDYKGGTLTDNGAGIDATVGDGTNSSGTLQGYGTLGLTGMLINNGRVIADGGNFVLTSFSEITTTIENPTTGGVNGWFATNGGTLTLPAISVAAGTNTYTWGETPGDTTIDLVNSARMTFTDVAGGDLTISLLARDNPEVPEFLTSADENAFAIGVWEFDPAHVFDFGTGSATLTFRYNDNIALPPGMSKSQFMLYHYTGGDWVEVAATVDTGNNLIYVSGINSFSDFLVGNENFGEPEPGPVPEPVTVLSFIAGMAMLGFRRLIKRK